MSVLQHYEVKDYYCSEINAYKDQMSTEEKKPKNKHRYKWHWMINHNILYILLFHPQLYKTQHPLK